MCICVRVRKRKSETYIIHQYIGYSIILSHIEWNRMDVCKFVSLKIVYWFDSFIHSSILSFIHTFIQSVCDPLSVRGQAFSLISRQPCHHTHWLALSVSVDTHTTSYYTWIDIMVVIFFSFQSFVRLFRSFTFFLSIWWVQTFWCCLFLLIYFVVQLLHVRMAFNVFFFGVRQNTSHTHLLHRPNIVTAQ